MISRFVFATAFVAVFAGCAVPAAQEGEGDTAGEAQKLAGGCRLVCPKCHPGDVCPMWACTQDCNAADPQSCVENMMCPAGYNWSKGQCSCIERKKPGATCVETVLCIQGYVWDSTSCQCVAQ